MWDSGGICVTPERRGEPSVAGRSAGSWAAGISLPARKSGSLPRRESPVGSVPCTSASPSLGIPGAAPGPESCVSHVLGAGIPTPLERAGMGVDVTWDSGSWQGDGCSHPGTILQLGTSGDIHALPRPGFEAASHWDICRNRREHLPGAAAFPHPVPDLWPPCLPEADEEK